MSGEEYEVEKICDFRVKNGEKQFLIKYKGYDGEEWLEDSKINCPDLKEEYIAEHQEEVDSILKKEERGKKKGSKQEVKESKQEKEKEAEEEDKEPEEKESKQKKDKQEKKSKKEKAEKPKKEKASKKASKKAEKSEKIKIIGYFRNKNKNGSYKYYYTMTDKNGEVKDIPSSQARAHYPIEIIEYLESQLPHE